MTGLEPADAYQRAAALFGETISTLSDDEWDLPTRPGDWTVVTTVASVVVGDAHVPAVVAGDRLPPSADVDTAVLGPQPVAAWRGTAVAAIAALREAGTAVSAELVGSRVTENLVRAWDIGRAVGRPFGIPDDLAEWCLDFWAGHPAAVVGGGVLAEQPVEPPAGASAPVRLLALTGRVA